MERARRHQSGSGLRRPATARELTGEPTGSPRAGREELRGGPPIDDGRRRLLLVVDSVDGGLAAVAARHRTWFTDRGWRVDVAGPNSGMAPQVVVDHHVAVPATARSWRQMAAAAAQLRGALRAYRPEVVHCHGPRSFAVAVAAGSRCPFVTIHGTGPVGSDPAGYGGVRKVAVRLLPRLAAGAFSAAPELPPPWRFLPHASPRLPSLARRPVPDIGPPTFLWLARMDEGRPAATFVRALVALTQRRPVRGVIAGDGPDVPAVAELVRRLEAPVEMLGHRDPVALLERCWALVLLSSHEAVNFAVQEAMWVGRPVVASPLPGLRWLAGDTARWVTGTDELVKALDALCEPGTAAAEGQRTATRIRTTIDPDDPWPDVAAAYDVRRLEHRGRRGRRSSRP